MLRVTVELVPHGDEMFARAIGEIIIANDGSHPDAPLKGNYTAEVRGSRRVPQKVYVEDHERLTLGWTYLLHRVLDQVAPPPAEDADRELREAAIAYVEVRGSLGFMAHDYEEGEPAVRAFRRLRSAVDALGAARERSEPMPDADRLPLLRRWIEANMRGSARLARAYELTDEHREQHRHYARMCRLVLQRFDMDPEALGRDVAEHERVASVPDAGRETGGEG
jgi:hypothetical protein